MPEAMNILMPAIVIMKSLEPLERYLILKEVQVIILREV